METLKIFFKIILLITYLFQKSVNAPPKNALPFLPNLNEVTPEAKRERERCIEIIYRELKCERPANTRYDIPKQVFGTIKANDLKSRETQQYFKHMHDQIIPLTRDQEPNIMPNPIEYCQIYASQRMHAKIHPTLKDRSCIARLREKFPITEDLQQILQHTFNNFVISELMYDNDYAWFYYYKILPYLGFDKDLMTPYEYCKGLTEDHVISQVISPKKKRGQGNSGESSSSTKQTKASSSSATRA